MSRAGLSAEHNHPEDGGKEFLHQGVWFHPVSIADTAPDRVAAPRDKNP